MNGEPAACGHVQMHGPIGFFTRLVADAVDTLAMMWDWFAGRFNWQPMRLFAAFAIGAAYLASPIDIVPDVIPFAGWIDDIMILTAVVRLARFDLERYRRWKTETGRIS